MNTSHGIRSRDASVHSVADRTIRFRGTTVFPDLPWFPMVPSGGVSFNSSLKTLEPSRSVGSTRPRGVPNGA